MSLGHLAKGASLDDLIETCIHSFDSEGKLCKNDQLLKATLTMHRLIISSTEMLQKLIALYLDALENTSSLLCHKICYLVRYWITEFWVMFKTDANLTNTVEKFQELLRANEMLANGPERSHNG